MKHTKNKLSSLRKVMAKAKDGHHVAPPAALQSLTVKLDPGVVHRVMTEVARRKRERLANRSIQSVMTEAIEAYIK